jgi:hypothetical protein
VHKRAKAYKIPEALKPEIERQINRLLSDGFLQPSTSPMASQILCVLKKSKTVYSSEVNGDHNTVQSKPAVRIVCNFRYLNRFAQPFPHLMPDPNDTTNIVAKFNFLSILDAKSGYWQTRIKPDKT